MTITAKDIMVTTFDKIHQDASVDQVIKMILNGKIRKSGHKTVSLIVVDDLGNLCGVITMFDLLFHLRPGFLNCGIDGHELSWDGQLAKLIPELKEKKVHQVMSRTTTCASPDDHLMVVLDRMVKKRYRRLPVVEDNKLLGVVYISDIYYKLFGSY